MLKYQRYQYKKAPLLEAIFEAKFSVENYDTTLPGQFFEKIRKKYPRKNDLNIITFTIGTSTAQQKDMPSIQAPIMQAWNDEHSSCMQIGPGIIAANDKKYLHWKDFSESIELLLKSYFECSKPIETKKIGFRCINRFVIPDNNAVITEYFRIGLILPQTFFGLNAFDMTILKDYNYESIEIAAKIRFASDSLKPDEKGVAFILDIECFTTKAIITERKEILDKANSCHALLKEIFESILQNKMRTLLEGFPE